jgi:hypothetical protein
MISPLSGLSLCSLNVQIKVIFCTVIATQEPLFKNTHQGMCIDENKIQ